MSPCCKSRKKLLTSSRKQLRELPRPQPHRPPNNRTTGVFPIRLEYFAPAWPLRISSKKGAIMDRQAAVMEKSGFATVNPSTGEQIETFSFFTSAQTEEVVARAEKSFQSFRKFSPYKRAQLFSNLANALRENKARLAKVVTTEMGKAFSEAEAEVEKCAHEADWYSEHGPKIMADEPAATGP